MSYSRWSNSYWYTFWHVVDKSVKENRDNAIFSCQCVHKFSAKQLRDSMDECLREVKVCDPQVGSDHLRELELYMHEFLADVDAKYPPNKE